MRFVQIKSENFAGGRGKKSRNFIPFTHCRVFVFFSRFVRQRFIKYDKWYNLSRWIMLVAAILEKTSSDESLTSPHESLLTEMCLRVFDELYVYIYFRFTVITSCQISKFAPNWWIISAWLADRQIHIYYKMHTLRCISENEFLLRVYARNMYFTRPRGL